MASTIKVDNVQNQPGTNIINKCGTTITVGAACNSVAVTGNVVKSNAVQASDGGNIVNQCGTTITLGASGDTVALACGASQTGFGSPGQLVDWQTGSIKTTGFTAATGEGYFCNTSGGGFNCTLPAGSAGSIVAVNDYSNSFSANNLTIVPDGSDKIGGIAGNAVLNTLGQTVTLVFVDATKGWQTIQDSSGNVAGPAYVVATGGSPCTGAICGDYKTHTFTGPGTLVVTCAGNSAGNSDVDYLVIAGGGSGSPTVGSGYETGGGGGGGYRESKTPLAPWTTGACTGTSLTLSATPYAIVVGGGGSGSPSCGTAGSTSSFATISSGGGGHGRANPGGSGGGTGGGGAGGSGNVPPTAPPQGFPGGGPSPTPQGSGGGGASAAGSPAPGPSNGGNGGAGFTSCIGCAPVARGGGGGGSKGGSGPSGGGAGASGTGAGTAGTVNTGGGGGAAYGGGGGAAGGGGGSGIVIVRYKFQ